MTETDYDRYRNSDAWKIKREGALARAASRCQLCRSTKKLNVHHNTYENLGNERDEDLFVLCKRCHSIFHGACGGHRVEAEYPKTPPHLSPLDTAKVEKLRRRAALTQQEAAVKAGMSKQQWSNIVRGRYGDISLSVVDRMAKALGVRAGELLK